MDPLDKMLKIIYEDNHLLVCEKPINMPVQADSSGNTDLLTLAKEYIKHKYNKPGEVYLGLVHRLDRPVGGVMVFARTSKAAARLTNSFKTRSTIKRYAAIVMGKPRDHANLRDWLVRDESTNTSFVSNENTTGAKEASLDYARVTTKNGLSLVDVLLHSGRHHQIRVQLSNSGFPIYGDQRYNRQAVVGQQIALYAYSLSIEHPTMKTRMTFTSIPSGGAWSAFTEELKALSCGVRCSYIDENVICVNKRAGIACTAADASAASSGCGGNSLETDLFSAFGGREVYPVHRLDVMTTGLVLFARNKNAEFELTKAIKQRTIKKTYHAEVFGRPESKNGRLTLYGIKDAERSIMSVYDRPMPRAVEMITDYRVISTVGGRSLLEIELVTGRTHQIRASLAHIGCPIVGDDKYGDRTLNKTNKSGLHLAAVRIEFPQDMGSLKGLEGRVIETSAEFEND